MIMINSRACAPVSVTSVANSQSQNVESLGLIPSSWERLRDHWNTFIRQEKTSQLSEFEKAAERNIYINASESIEFN